MSYAGYYEATGEELEELRFVITKLDHWFIDTLNQRLDKESKTKAKRGKSKRK